MARDCDAFISYTRQQGAPVAERVFELLKSEGFAVWQDRVHMRGGDDFWRQIEAAIERTHYLIMVLTPDAFEDDRPVLRNEWLTARRRGCCIVPVHQKNAVDFSSPNLPPWLGKLDCYDLDNDNHRQKLLTDLRTTPHVRPIPHNVEFPAHYVRRDHEMRNLVAMLMSAPVGGRVAITTALRGAGGFGKTTVARAVCFEDEVLARYTDGVLWLTVGEGARGVPELLAALLSQLGHIPKSSDQDPLFGEWKEALRTRQCLIVLDDVWREFDAQSLVVGETSSAFLITTRFPRVASAVDASDCLVDAMTAEQSIALLAAALVDGHALHRNLEDHLRSLADRAGFWPVLLGLIAGQLRLTLRRPGASAAVAIEQVEEDLQQLGLTAFDRNDPNQRSAAVKSTVEASLRYLTATDREAEPRYYELAVFPDDVAIPLEALQDLWRLRSSATRRLAERFDDSGLATLHFEHGLSVHDVFLHYLRAKWTPDDLVGLHRRLLSAWPDLQRLPHPYAWRWYGWHCIEAKEAGTLARALLDFDWLKARLQKTDLGSLLADCDRAIAADHVPRYSLSLVKEALEKSAHVLLPAPDQLANQFYGRLRAGLSDEIDEMLRHAKLALTTQSLAPLIQNLQPVGSALRRTLRGHEGAVKGALALADGRLLSWSDDQTLRLWSSDGAPLAQLHGHEGAVKGALALADGRLLSWSRDQTLRLWDLATRVEMAALYFDAAPTVVVALASERVFVGDALGSVHWVRVSPSPGRRCSKAEVCGNPVARVIRLAVEINLGPVALEPTLTLTRS